jgi:hypothetical protein
MEATMRRKRKDKEINFWPAYVDALINVVLNLLLLVGVFTIGLVVLNGETFNQEKKIAELRVREMHAADQPPPSARGTYGVLQVIPTITKLSALPLTMPEKKVERDKLQITEIRIANPRATTGTSMTTGARGAAIYLEEKAMEIARSMAPGKVLMRLDFEINQYITPKSFSLSTDMTMTSNKKYLLLCIADSKNQRIAREAFARLMAVRTSLIQAGVGEAQIAIQAVQPIDESSLPINVDRSVYVIDLQNE